MNKTIPQEAVPSELQNNETLSQTQQNARLQALDIKKQADEQLLRLMQEQQSKLNEMVQHLKQPNSGAKTELNGVAQQKVEQNLPLTTASPKDTNTATPGATDANQHNKSSGQESTVPDTGAALLAIEVPLQAVTVLQESNLDHLDVIMSKIQKSLKTTSDSVTTTQLQGDLTDDKRPLDI